MLFYHISIYWTDQTPFRSFRVRLNTYIYGLNEAFFGLSLFQIFLSYNHFSFTSIEHYICQH